MLRLAIISDRLSVIVVSTLLRNPRIVVRILFTKLYWLFIVSLPDICVYISSYVLKINIVSLFLGVMCLGRFFLVENKGFQNMKHRLYLQGISKLMPLNWMPPSLCSPKRYICSRRILNRCALLAWTGRCNVCIR